MGTFKIETETAVKSYSGSGLAYALIDTQKQAVIRLYYYKYDGEEAARVAATSDMAGGLEMVPGMASCYEFSVMAY